LELDLADTALAERVAMIPTAARVGARTVSFPCEDYVRLMKNLIVSTTLAKGVMDPVY
jgi:D-aminopeptidase